MCGRYSWTPGLFPKVQKTLSILRTSPETDAAESRYNMAPRQFGPVITSLGRGAYSLDLMRWGLIFPYWQNPPREYINARAEKAHNTPAFRAATVRLDAWSLRMDFTNGKMKTEKTALALCFRARQADGLRWNLVGQIT